MLYFKNVDCYERELDEITSKDINDYGFILIHNHGFLESHKIVMACTCTGTFGNKKVPVIIVDNHFLNLDDICQEIIMLHELGHKVDEENEKKGIAEELRADNFIKNYHSPKVIRKAMKKIFMAQYNIKGYLTEKQKEVMKARLDNMK